MLARIADFSVTVIPGDTSIERGNSLVVLARFGATLPTTVELVISETPGATRTIPLVKSLADPIFGGSVPEVTSNFVYNIRYGGQRTHDFKVTVFEYPRLERADVDLTFPEYTKQPAKRIENTRRLSAVEGSRVDLALELNKPVSSARLIAKDKDRSIVPLLVETNRPIARLQQFTLEASKTYELQLVDPEGRTNKVPAQFVFDALKNRPPELKIASPGGDVRPSSLEELSFEGTVWDDFGVQSYGLPTLCRDKKRVSWIWARKFRPKKSAPSNISCGWKISELSQTSSWPGSCGLMTSDPTANSDVRPVIYFSRKCVRSMRFFVKASKAKAARRVNPARRVARENWWSYRNKS